MTDSFREVLQEAKRNKFATIWTTLSDQDVIDVWDDVSSFVKKNLLQQKGVSIPGFGVFSFTQVKLDIGNNKLMVSQRPVFIVSEKLVKTHGLNQKKYNIPGGPPVVPLNLAQLSVENQHSFSRDTVEACIHEVIGALSRCIASGRSVEFTFTGIGRLLIRDSVVKMKFLKSFIQTWDGTGKLVESLQGRPTTADSVMSEASTVRRSTSALILPRNSHSDDVNALAALPTINEDLEHEGDLNVTDRDEDGITFLDVQQTENIDVTAAYNSQETDNPKVARNEGRVSMVVPQATAFSWDDLMPPTSPLPRSAAGSTAPQLNTNRQSPTYRSGTALSNNDVTDRRALTSRSIDALHPPSTAASSRSSVSSCGHDNAGQELCYVCHQRARRNVYVSFAEERRRKEDEENQLLHDYQQFRNAVDIQKEQEKLLARRQEMQKTALYNRSAAESATARNQAKDLDYFPSFVFRKRALTPPPFIKQEKYREDLDKQVMAKVEAEKRRKNEEDFLGRLEQVQLAEDIAAQRQFHLQQKTEKMETYKRALSAQVKLKSEIERPQNSPEPLYFANDFESRDEAMQEKRRRANELFKEQVALVEQRKRDAILKRLEEQRNDENVLQRNKRDTLIDAAERYERLVNNRHALEEDWKKAAEKKRERDSEELRDRLQPDKELVLDQCTRYRRCGQCRRRLSNRGETNVWCETRYIPGCRIMV